MSIHLKYQAAWQASLPGLISKQIFHSIPQIPPVVTLVGKTAIVTGSNSGLGLECSTQFLELKLSRLIMAVRSEERGETAASKLRAAFPSAQIDVWVVDMESYRSVQGFASRCQTLPRLDIVVLNAGLCTQSLQRSAETSHEVTLQVTYFSNVLLAILLLPKLRAKANPDGLPGRLTFVASDGAIFEPMAQFDGLDILQSLDQSVIGSHKDGLSRYSHTKLMLVMFLVRLVNFVSADDVIINIVNPSAVGKTAIGREMTGISVALIILRTLMYVLGRELRDGGRIYLHASVVLGKESHGSFVDRIIRPYPPIIYTDVGCRLTNKLWDETMEELKFAEVEKILKEM